MFNDQCKTESVANIYDFFFIFFAVKTKVRSAAASAIGMLDPSISNGALGNLINLLKDGYWKVRYSACAALQQLGPFAALAIDSLLIVLKDGSVNRNQAACTLASIGDSGESALTKIVMQDSHISSQIRVSAAYGLSFSNVLSPHIDKVIECLYATTKDRIPSVRKAVLKSLGKLGVTSG